jgi:hypothetical protein
MPPTKWLHPQVSALAVILVVRVPRYEVTLTMPARHCTIHSHADDKRRFPAKIAPSPDADFLVYRSPYPLMLMSWASGARQGACPVGRFSPAVGPHDPGW